MSFLKWKRARNNPKDRICNDREEIKSWLCANGQTIAYVVNEPRVCKTIKKKCHIINYTLYLKVKGFKKPYVIQNVLSLSLVRSIIQDEYFKIFGNLCGTISYTARILEYPYSKHVKIQKWSIYATVTAIWRQERSSFTINRFMWNYTHRNEQRLCNLVKRNFKGDAKLVKKLSFAEFPSFHKGIVDYFTNNKPKNISHPRLVLIFGVPGSGKNWVLKQRRQRNHVIINVDDCRAMLPKYWKAIISLHTSNEDWIIQFRDECAMISKQIFTYALQNRMNMVWNGTGKNFEKYHNLIVQAKSKGYIIELMSIYAPLHLAKRRVLRRASITGRIVPEKTVDMAAKKIPYVFKKLVIDADHARIWGNFRKCKSPIMLWDKYQGGKYIS